jgi:protocatechuate 3,4-dioxygenase beta subunit
MMMHPEMIEVPPKDGRPGKPSWRARPGKLPLLMFGLFAVALLAACSSPSTLTVTAQYSPVAPPTGTIASLPAALDPSTASTAPDCSSPALLTPALTEGPYFKANSPERASLVDANTPGTPLVLTGYVLTTDCQPVAHALLDFWQADAAGQYDNRGYTLRGHQYTDKNGRYQLTTIVPGLYPGRTEHIHFKAQAPNGPVLTSQLFFPGVTNNVGDQIFNLALLIHITQESSRGIQATFDFIITP